MIIHPKSFSDPEHPFVSYRIRCKSGCNSNPPHEMCNAELSYKQAWVEEYPIKVVTITKSGGKTWGLRKVNIYQLKKALATALNLTVSVNANANFLYVNYFNLRS